MTVRRKHVPAVYAALPNLASAHEQGLADFEAPTWFAAFLPRGASEPIIRKLNQAAFATGDTPSVQERGGKSRDQSRVGTSCREGNASLQFAHHQTDGDPRLRMTLMARPGSASRRQESPVRVRLLG
jgi:hypothetical protein